MTRHKSLREARRVRIRKRLRARGSRPRLSVFRSGKHIYGQIIDDERGVTLASASDMTPVVGEKKQTKGERATAVGTLIAERAIKAGVTLVVFDRGAYKFHGRIKALAEAARKGGLEF